MNKCCALLVAFSLPTNAVSSTSTTKIVPSRYFRIA